MLRLLEEGRCRGLELPDGGHAVAVVVSYEQQWRTLFKAQKLGYVSNDTEQRLTENGVAFLAEHGISAVFTLN